MSIFIVTGAGPVGTTVALQLARDGHQVRMLTRSGGGPEHPAIERRTGDANGDLTELMAGASAVFHCIHAPYSAKAWAAQLPGAEAGVMAAAYAVGAPVVFPESLYAYGHPDGVLTESSPRAADWGKPGVRTRLLRARAAHPARTISVVASDFFGPYVRNAHAGERLIPRVMQGRPVRVVGSLDHLHSFTFVPDLAAAMIAAARRQGESGDEVLHAPTGPALTQRELITAVAEAAEVPVPKTGVIPVGLLRGLGLVMPSLRELAELGYQLTAPFVMDSTASQKLLDLEPTPMREALARTVAWWRTGPAAAARQVGAEA